MVTASCGVQEAPQLPSWLEPSTLCGKPALALIPHLGDATHPNPLLPTPAGQMSPIPPHTALQGYTTLAAKTVDNKPGFPLLADGRSLRKPTPSVRVSPQTQD